MQVRDKWIVAILILLMVLTGMTYYGLCVHNNDTDTQTGTQTIIVSGDGSSGTGDVTNTQQVQVVSSGGTKTVYVEAEQQSDKQTVTPPDKDTSQV